MSIAALPTTTLTNAILYGDHRFVLGSTTGIVAKTKFVVGAEIMLVTDVPVSGTVEVMRGVDGTRPYNFAAGTTVYIATALTALGIQPNGRIGLVGNPTVFPAPYTLPVGSIYADPGSGFEYILCDAQTALVINEWCVIDGAGLATQLAAASIGRVGIVVDAAGASDTLVWVLVAGVWATARTSSDFVTSQMPMAGTGKAVPYLTSVGGNLLWRVKATTAASGTSSLDDDTAAVYLDHPWVQGIGFWMNS
jgi:hypothetical protein